MLKVITRSLLILLVSKLSAFAEDQSIHQRDNFFLNVSAYKISDSVGQTLLIEPQLSKVFQRENNKYVRFHLSPSAAEDTCKLFGFGKLLKQSLRTARLVHTGAIKELINANKPSAGGNGPAIISVVCSTNEREASDQNQIRTVAGAIFTRVRNIRSFGEAWRDPSGVIWSDLLNDQAVYQDEAKKKCESIGSRLPTDEEVKRLVSYMQVPESDDHNTVYRPQILLHPLASFWTSGRYVNSRGDQFENYFASIGTSEELDSFYYRGYIDGGDYPYYRTKTFVRCVR